MANNAVRTDFTPKELAYFLFGKKRCPQCGGQLDRSTECEIRPGSDFNSKRGTMLAKNAEVRYTRYYYTCRACGAKFPLSKLAE